VSPAPDLAARLRAEIEAHGPMRLDRWMAACNAHYYAAADPLGRDFTTAPEISQMFGELVGGWLADLWLRAGAPSPVVLAELGPGRGSLMADALRVAGRVPGFLAAARLHLVETSPALRNRQAQALPGATWHDSFDTVPADAPLLLVANEFFDALPVRQATAAGERGVGLGAAGFEPVLLPGLGERTGEWSEAGEALAAAIGDRLRARGGAALLIDYGHDGGAGETLQAIRDGAPADPFAAPGAADLTAHVDFAALRRAAGAVSAAGPVGQGVWLTRLGIAARAEQLKARATPAQRAAIDAALVRLTSPGQMGALFKVMALTAPGWPAPAGFDA
jgi:SAM-dependent MidA family methyltransferase